MKAYIVHDSPLGTDYWGEGMYTMKAILRGKKWKEIDVEYIGRTQNVRFYKDKSDGKVYPEDALELKEYYGG